MASVFACEASGTAIKTILHRYEKEKRLVKDDLLRFLSELGIEMTEDEVEEKMKLIGCYNMVFDLQTFFEFILNELEVHEGETDVINAFKVILSEKVIFHINKFPWGLDLFFASRKAPICTYFMDKNPPICAHFLDKIHLYRLHIIVCPSNFSFEVGLCGRLGESDHLIGY